MSVVIETKPFFSILATAFSVHLAAWIMSALDSCSVPNTCATSLRYYEAGT